MRSRTLFSVTCVALMIGLITGLFLGHASSSPPSGHTCRDTSSENARRKPPERDSDAKQKETSKAKETDTQVAATEFSAAERHAQSPPRLANVESRLRFAFAQHPKVRLGNAQITGHVTDRLGMPIGGAKVELQSFYRFQFGASSPWEHFERTSLEGEHFLQASRALRHVLPDFVTTTDSKGRYTFKGLAYDQGLKVRASAVGFATQVLRHPSSHRHVSTLALPRVLLHNITLRGPEGEVWRKAASVTCIKGSKFGRYRIGPDNRGSLTIEVSPSSDVRYVALAGENESLSAVSEFNWSQAGHANEYAVVLQLQARAYFDVQLPKSEYVDTWSAYELIARGNRDTLVSAVRLSTDRYRIYYSMAENPVSLTLSHTQERHSGIAEKVRASDVEGVFQFPFEPIEGRFAMVSLFSEGKPIDRAFHVQGTLLYSDTEWGAAESKVYDLYGIRPRPALNSHTCAFRITKNIESLPRVSGFVVRGHVEGIGHFRRIYPALPNHDLLIHLNHNPGQLLLELVDQEDQAILRPQSGHRDFYLFRDSNEIIERHIRSTSITAFPTSVGGLGFQPVEPGDYLLVGVYRHQSAHTCWLVQRLSIKSGTQKVRVTMPDIHTLTVKLPDERRNRTWWYRSEGYGITHQLQLYVSGEYGSSDVELKIPAGNGEVVEVASDKKRVLRSFPLHITSDTLLTIED